MKLTKEQVKFLRDDLENGRTMSLSIYAQYNLLDTIDAIESRHAELVQKLRELSAKWTSDLPTGQYAHMDETQWDRAQATCAMELDAILKEGE